MLGEANSDYREKHEVQVDVWLRAEDSLIQRVQLSITRTVFEHDIDRGAFPDIGLGGPGSQHTAFQIEVLGLSALDGAR